jgi:hypothetical protein
MTIVTAGQSVTELATVRQAILDSFGDNDTEAADLEKMDRLYPVEAMIAKAVRSRRGQGGRQRYLIGRRHAALLV